jgi:hypothetical protein
MVERQPSKLDTWVRFPSPAPAGPRAAVVRRGERDDAAGRDAERNNG